MKKLGYVLQQLNCRERIIWTITFLLNCFQTFLVNILFGYSLKWGMDSIFRKDIRQLHWIIMMVIIGGVYLIFALPIIDYFMVRESFRLKKKLMDQVFNTVLKNRKKDFDHSAVIVDFLQNDTKEASKILNWDFVVIFQALISGIGAFILIGYYDLTMAFLCLIVGFIIFLLNNLAKKRLDFLLKEKRAAWKNILKLVSDLVDNLKIIQVYSLLNYYQKNFNKSLNTYEFSESQIEKQKLSIQTLNNFLSDFVIYILILCYGCKLVSENQITIGTVLLFLQLSIGITFLFQCIGDYFVNCSSIYFSMDKIKKLMDSSYDTLENKIVNFNGNGLLECQNLFYQYGRNNKMILDNINFKLHKGELLLIKGKNGSGKSTLSKILANIYEDYCGNILLDGVSIKEIPQKEYVRMVGYVSQDSYFIQGSLLENIELGYKDYEKDYLEELIHVCQLDDLVEKNRSKIFEKGSNLSFGEKQRISFVRALLRNPSIVILDELDANIETKLYLKILNYLIEKSKTILLIDHNDFDYGSIFLENNLNIHYLNLDE